jgi:CO/xanthine dehydrogenase Mo-binding subunit
MMGLGFGLSEKYVMLDGIPQMHTLLECGIPTIQDMPEIQAIIVEDPDPNGPFGAKGLGEISILPTAAAIANAIYDATGVRITSLPANPQNVARAIHEHNNPSL